MLIQSKRLLIALHIVEIRRLRFGGVVDNRVSVAVVMRFRQRVGAIGLLIHIFLACRPQNRSIQKFRVVRAVRQARDIETSTFAVLVRRRNKRSHNERMLPFVGVIFRPRSLVSPLKSLLDEIPSRRLYII